MNKFGLLDQLVDQLLECLSNVKCAAKTGGLAWGKLLADCRSFLGSQRNCPCLNSPLHTSHTHNDLRNRSPEIGADRRRLCLLGHPSRPLSTTLTMVQAISRWEGALRGKTENFFFCRCLLGIHTVRKFTLPVEGANTGFM